MQLTISGSKLLQELQHDFTTVYPFLKMEFFQPLQGRTGPASAANMLKHSMKISEARLLQKDGIIEIDDCTRVSELEKVLRDKFGLHAQIFRKSGNIWLETTMSDSWTLKQQNEHGREISAFTNLPDDEA